MKAPVYSRLVEVHNRDGKLVLRQQVTMRTAADKREAQGYARAAGMNLDEFVDDAFGHRGTFRRRPNPLPDIREEITAEKVGFTCSDPALLERIRRAAAHDGDSLEEYVAASLACSVEYQEDDMVVHAPTGKVIASWDRLHRWEGDFVRIEDTTEAPEVSAALATR